MTIYTAASGALVFATGSIQWSWGLDSYNAPGWHTLRVSEPAQQVTRNVLTHMLEAVAVPRPPSPAMPSAVVVLAAVVAAAFVIRAWLARPKPRGRVGTQ
jgi:hypothetical protein